MRKFRILIIGSGNVAWHLAKAFSKQTRIELSGIYSRNNEQGNALSKLCEVPFFNNFGDLKGKAECFIICASDDAIENIAQQLPLKNEILAHTSGVVSMDVLKNATRNYGSFYPLQTFTKNRQVDLQQVPFLIDGSNQQTKTLLFDLAKLLSNNVQYVSDKKRRELHVAAVIINNFSNHLFALAKEYTNAKHLDFDLLKPLLLETAQKALEQNPKDIQTGPAKRKDKKTIDQHLAFIEDEKLKELYIWFTESIGTYYE